MGLKNSPNIFQRLMEAVLRGLSWTSCLVYMDDIVVFSTNWTDHIKHIREVFERLQKAGLKLKPSKCFFGKSSINYLGHFVSKDGISPDPEKVSAVTNYPVPKSIKDVRAFLGLSGYYRKFIKNYAQIANPLHELTKKDVPFIWDENKQNAFEMLKQALVSYPVLAYPQYDKHFRLYTDASAFSVGAVLAQVQDGVERVISYVGRSLNKCERKYGITEKELLALIFAVKRLDPYLRFTTFTAIVDHTALKWLLSLKEPTGKFARWIAYLQSYNFEIETRPGIQHGNADGVSRREYTEIPELEDDEPNYGPTPEYVVDQSIPPPQPNVNASPTQSEVSGSHAPLTQPVLGASENTVSEAETHETVTPSRPQPRINEADSAPTPHIHAVYAETLSQDALKTAQREDSWYSDIIVYLDSGELPENKKRRAYILSTQPRYFLHSDILYHVSSKEGRGLRGDYTLVQIAIPKKYVQTILHENHDSA